MTYVDPADWLLYAGLPWRAKAGRGGYYAFCRIKVAGRQRGVYLHRLISKCPAGKHVHHVDGRTLNNHRDNLENMDPNIHDDLHKFKKISRRHS